MEATSVTGPAKNLINFCRWTRTPQAAESGFRFSIAVATFSRSRDPGSSNEFISALRAEDIPVHVVHERYRFDRGVLPQMTRIVRDIDPQIVQTHMVKSHFLFKSTGLRNSRKWLAFQHGYTATDLKGRMYNQLDRLSLRSADRVIAVCQAFVPRLLQYGVRQDRVRILHNSVRIPPAAADEETTQLRARLGLLAGEKAILTIGRFSKEKGHSVFLEALGALQALDPQMPWKAVLVGKGPELSSLERLSARLGLKQRVVFAGFHANVAPFYAIADLFALPSRSEGSPNVLLEAMAARVPIASTRAGGVPEIVSDETTALLVPVGDARGLGFAMSRLLKDDDLRARLAATAFDRARQDFSPELYLHSLAAIYADALELPSHASLGHRSAL
jgi:glycosyltransferase involved in cell wall biosynthesis